MTFQYNPLTIPLIFSVIISLTVIFLAFARRHVPGAKSFIWLMLCVTEWTIFYIVSLSTVELPAQAAWTKYYFIGIVFVPLSWFVFSLEYSRMSHLLTRPRFYLLLSIPIAIIILIWTNDYHHIIWTENVIRQTEQGLIVDFPSANAWGWWIHTAYSYIFVLLGSFILVRQSLTSPAAFASQPVVIIIGSLFPFVANILYNFWPSQTVKFDLTPFALMISGIFYAWGLFRMGLFDLLPVAGEVVLEGLEDGVMVVDQTDRVVYVNPAFVAYAGVSTKQAIGATTLNVLARWPEVVSEFQVAKNTNAQISIQFGKDGDTRFELRVSPLLDFNRRKVGHLFILRRVTNPAGARAVDLTSATSRRKLLLMTMMANGEVVSVNQHFVGTLGYTRAEIIEQYAIKIWQSAEQRATLIRKVRNEGVENAEISLVAKSGQIICLIVSAKAISINEETCLFFAMREK